MAGKSGHAYVSTRGVVVLVCIDKCYILQSVRINGDFRFICFIGVSCTKDLVFAVKRLLLFVEMLLQGLRLLILSKLD